MRYWVPEPLPLKDIRWKNLLPLLGKAHQQIGRFDALLTRPFPFYTLLRRREAVASVQTSRGGNPADYEEALELLPKWMEQGIYGDHFFRKVHRCVKRDAPLKRDIGALRNRQNWIGPNGCTMKNAYFIPPPADRVPHYFQQFEAYARTKDVDPIVQLAILFGQFLIIHPFMDGNGRVIRIFVPAFLCKRGLTRLPLFFLSPYFKKHKRLYFHYLHEITTASGWEGWITFFLQAVIDQGKIQCTLLQ